MTPRAFPRKVAIFDNDFIFTTLTQKDVFSHTRLPFCHPDSGEPCHLFTLDNEMVYAPFAQDHGPFNLAFTFQACVRIHDKLNDHTAKRPLCLYTTTEPKHKSNMILMVALYFLIVGHKEPWDAFKPIAQMEVMPFRDAGSGVVDHGLSILDCLYGMYRALQHQLLDLVNFDPSFYTFYERVDDGDLNILGPFIPFASPIEESWVTLREASGDGKPMRTPRTKARVTSPAFKRVLKVFQDEDVGMVVRLNDELYDKRHFLDLGMNHIEMYFNDGSNPSDDIVREFIRLAEETIERQGKKVAVHCKAGLGRTGVLIGAYFIYKYQFSAQEVIAFMRIVRPGMVVGPQQQYLLLNQMKWIQWAARDEMMKELEAAQGGPTNPLATPPSEDIPLLPSSVRPSQTPGSTILRDLTKKLQSPTPSRSKSRNVALSSVQSKGGDAAGQPRKSRPQIIRQTPDSRVTSKPDTLEIAVELPASPPQAVLRESAMVLPSSSGTESSRGVKRTSTRLPVSSSSASQILMTSARLTIPILRRSSSSSSIASIAASESERPYKRRPITVDSSPLAKTGLSSPPPSRESSPLADVEMPESFASTVSRIPSRLRLRSPALQPEIPSTPPLSATSSSAPVSASVKRSFIPRLASRERSMEPIQEDIKEVKSERSKRVGLTPPKFARDFFRTK